LLRKHPLAVSRWVAEAARARLVDPGREERMTRLDEDLSTWVLATQTRGAFVPRKLSE